MLLLLSKVNISSVSAAPRSVAGRGSLEPSESQAASASSVVLPTSSHHVRWLRLRAPPAPPAGLSPLFSSPASHRSTRLAFNKAWLSDPATYPLFVSIGAGVLLCAGCSGRYLFRCPDVTWNKTERGQILRTSKPYDEKWYSHKKRFARIKDNALNVNPEMQAALDRVNKAGGPSAFNKAYNDH